MPGNCHEPVSEQDERDALTLRTDRHEENVFFYLWRQKAYVLFVNKEEGCPAYCGWCPANSMFRWEGPWVWRPAKLPSMTVLLCLFIQLVSGQVQVRWDLWKQRLSSVTSIGEILQKYSRNSGDVCWDDPKNTVSAILAEPGGKITRATCCNILEQFHNFSFLLVWALI